MRGARFFGHALAPAAREGNPPVGSPSPSSFPHREFRRRVLLPYLALGIPVSVLVSLARVELGVPYGVSLPLFAVVCLGLVAYLMWRSRPIRAIWVDAWKEIRRPRAVPLRRSPRAGAASAPHGPRGVTLTPSLGWYSKFNGSGAPPPPRNLPQASTLSADLAAPNPQPSNTGPGLPLARESWPSPEEVRDP